MFKNILFALLLSVIAAPASLGDGQGSIIVHITGLQNNQGVVRIALFNSSEAYTYQNKNPKIKARGAFKKAAVPISSKECTYAFNDVPYGEYAIKMYHDEKNNGEFETGLLGIPKAEYGFSNNALGRMGPAPYEKAKFILNQPTTTINIRAHRGL